MFSTIFTILITGFSVYFFYQNNFFLGIILLIWSFSRLFGFSLQRLFKGLGELTIHSGLERKCNVFIELKINIAEVLNHKILNEIFEKLKNKKVIKFQNKDEWVATLIDNYKKKYKNSGDHTIKGIRYIWEQVRFNIKSNLLWKNGEIDFNDTVYHEWFIPYEYKSVKEEEERISNWIGEGITIRAFIINGILKLQVGHFDKEFSPKVLREGSLGVYQKYATITSFPLMYFSYAHKIPENYLNLSMYATESYWDSKGKGDGDFTKDWKELNKEINEYNFVCNLADEYDLGSRLFTKWDKIVKKFNENKENWLRKEGFENLSYVPKDDDYIPDFLEDNDIHYTNKYLSVRIANDNDYKEKREKYTYPDYWEKTP